MVDMLNDDMKPLSRTNAWQLRTRTLEFPIAPAIMGIVNVTPDSFSDGGNFRAHDQAIAHGRQLAADGADILDIGGESTRPGSNPVDSDEELARVIPVIEALSRAVDLPISIDTSKAEVAAAAMEAGAEIINDVTALEGDPRMIDVARNSGGGICAMHMQGTPQTMQDKPLYDDVIEEVYEYLIGRRDRLTEQGIEPDKICLDPGIGFGKTHEHNLQLLAGIERFLDTGCPLLVGHSRKGFIKKITGDETPARVAGTLAVSLYLARAGVQVIRVHDVRETREGLLMQRAIEGSPEYRL
ncbi:MAG: dihydropteroate synthase [Pirellulaceae bacterium]